MNAIVKAAQMPSLQMSEGELMNVLRNSLYPGAKTESIKLVISYCKASGLDPMRKPVHIVPMWDSKAGEMRDVIMPGIGSYRTDAARSGEYAGVSEPEFGPDVTEALDGVSVTYPSWCRVSVKRLLPNGAVAEFSAVERWKENYAQKGGKDKSIAPNAMWLKRPYAQLAKCAEAQALRKAFPEVGAAPTADEMEGKALDDSQVVEGTATRVAEQPNAYPAADFEKNKAGWVKKILDGSITLEKLQAMVKSKGEMTAEQVQEMKAAMKPADHGDAPANAAVLDALRKHAEEAGITDAEIAKHLGVESLDGITLVQVEKAQAFLQNPMGA